jgi:hypothetical protein
LEFSSRCSFRGLENARSLTALNISHLPHGLSSHANAELDQRFSFSNCYSPILRSALGSKTISRKGKEEKKRDFQAQASNTALGSQANAHRISTSHQNLLHLKHKNTPLKSKMQKSKSIQKTTPQYANARPPIDARCSVPSFPCYMSLSVCSVLK